MAADLTTRAKQASSAVTSSAQQDEPSIGSIIQSMRPEIQRALPRHMDADRMARIALTVVRKTPQLLDCSRASFMGALMTSAQLGLEPGTLGEAYLTPYRDRRRGGPAECQLIIGYQGYTKLFWQHPLASYLDAQAVYENDEFDFEYGLNPHLTHKPRLGDRGEVLAYYAVAKLTRGAPGFVVLSAAQVAALRGTVGAKGSIPDPERWMEKKTAVRQLLKLMPKSTQLAQALAVDETVRTNLTEDGIEDTRRITPEAHSDEPEEFEEPELDPEAARADAEWLNGTGEQS